MGAKSEKESKKCEVFLAVIRRATARFPRLRAMEDTTNGECAREKREADDQADGIHLTQNLESRRLVLRTAEMFHHGSTGVQEKIVFRTFFLRDASSKRRTGISRALGKGVNRLTCGFGVTDS